MQKFRELMDADLSGMVPQLAVGEKHSFHPAVLIRISNRTV